MAAEGRITGRTALVTGAGRGFGRAIALGFAREGADVAIAYRTSQAEAQATAVEVECVGRQVLLIRSDLAQARQARSLAEQVLSAFGRVDILVNNAGIMDVAPFVDQDPAMWDAMLTINISGPLHQRIINLSSQLTHVGGADFAVYSGTKGFILTVTKSLAREVDRFGITVNAICPGSIVTAMNRHIYPPERQTKRAIGDPTDVAGAALYRASPDGRVITGAVHRPPLLAEQRIKARHPALAHVAR